MTQSKEKKEASQDVSVSPPVVALTVLGSLIAVLGLFAAGDIWVVVVGLAAVTTAGLLHAWGGRR